MMTSSESALTADIAWLRDRAFMTEKGGDDVIYERIAKRLEALNAECERAWKAYQAAHDQAMSNGQALADARAQGMAPEGRGREGGPGSSELPSPVAESDAPKGESS